MTSSLSGLTVRRAMIIAVLVGVMLPAMLVGAYQARVLFDSLQSSIKSFLAREGSIVALGVRESLWALDVESARTLVEAVADDPAIVSIEVKDLQHGRFVFSERAAHRTSASEHLAEVPVTYRGEQIGTVLLRVTEARFMQQLRGQLTTMGLLLIVQMAGSVLLILVVLHQRITFPLGRLVSDAQRLATGDLDEPIHSLRDDEIGRVQSQLESTRKALRGLIVSLEQKNVALEQDLRVRERVQAALRNSEQKFSSLFQEAPVPLALLRRIDAVFLDVNAALATELGFRPDEMIGRTTAQLGLYADQTERQRVFDLLEVQGYVDEYEVRFQTRDGQVLDIQLHMRLVQTSEPCILVAMVNISPLRAAQRKVEELNLSLERRVIERTRALADTNHELEGALDRLQRTHNELVQSEKLAALGSLVAGVSHELNTPIGNSLMVSSTLRDLGREFRAQMESGLKRSTLERFVSETEAAADILTRNLGVAGELIASFKQVAVDQTSSQRRSFSLREVVREIILTAQPAFRKTPFVIEEAIPDDIWMDSFPGPFGQVVTNLLNNTLLHAFEGRSEGKVLLEASAAGEQVIFRCTDDGVGIEAANLGKIFDPFYTTKLGKKGTGLGLNIVHNIVTGVLGGEIQVHSEVGAGTCFTVTLPVVAPTKGEAERFDIPVLRG